MPARTANPADTASGTSARLIASRAASGPPFADRPDLVVVVGDVNSTVACSLTAKKLGIRVVHMDAGLRSFDTGMPAEINRKLTDAISDLLFVTEESTRGPARGSRRSAFPETGSR